MRKVMKNKMGRFIAILMLFSAILPCVHAAPVSVWLDNGAAPGSSNTETPFTIGGRDSTWDVSATAENGLAEIGAAVMSVRMLTSAWPNGDGAGISRTATGGFGNGLAVTGSNNDKWMDAGEAGVFQLTFYSDAAKTTEMVGLDITLTSMIARTANTNLAVDFYVGSGELNLTGDTDDSYVTLDGNKLLINSDAENSSASELGLTPDAVPETGFYTFNSDGGITFGTTNTFWVRRGNLNGAGNAAYQLSGIFFEVTKVVPSGEGEVTVYLDDGGQIPGSSNTNQPFSVGDRDVSWDVSASAENGLIDIGAAVMTVRMLPISYPKTGKLGVSRGAGAGYTWGLSVFEDRGEPGDQWMYNGDGAVFQFAFYEDAAKTTEINDVNITLSSLTARMASSNMAMNVFAGEGELLLTGSTDSDDVTLAGNRMTIGNDSANSFVSEPGLAPTNFTGTDVYTIAANGTVSFDETDTLWVRRDNLNGAANVAYQLGAMTFAVKIQSTYATWANFYDLEGGPSDDDDQDGLSNIYEYGVAGNPADALDQGTLPEFSVLKTEGGNILRYIYPQRSGSSDELTYSIELNTDLVSGTWTNAGYSVTGTNVTGGTLDFVTNTVDTVEGQKFIRLIIE